jgi:hypothetical protein
MRNAGMIRNRTRSGTVRFMGASSNREYGISLQ